MNFGGCWSSDFWIFWKKISIDLLSRSWNASYFYLFWIGEIAIHSSVHTGHLIITKFCQDAKKTILVKVWPLKKSLPAVCHSTADPKSLNFISKCIFMDSDCPVSGRMGFFYQIMALANKNIVFGWYRPTTADIGWSAANI